jgi:putative mRNA 3-end processing factor
VYAHGAILAVHDALRAQGVPLREALAVSGSEPKSVWRNALILAPPNAADSAWTRRFEPLSLGMASGWMALRGARRRRAADRGFVLSDHADWDGLNAAIRATGAERVLVTHGYSEIFSRWLCEQGYDARPLETGFEGEVEG